MKNVFKSLATAAGIALFVGFAGGTAIAYYDSAGSRANAAKPVESGKVVAVIDMTSLLEFKPAKLTVRVGDTVEWRNVSSFGHTVTADAARAMYASNVALPEGVKPFNFSVRGAQSVRYRFDKPGLYRYVCLPHEGSGMMGTIEVKPAT